MHPAAMLKLSTAENWCYDLGFVEQSNYKKEEPCGYRQSPSSIVL